MKLFLYVLRSLVLSFAFAMGAIVVLAVPGVAVSAVSRLPGVDTITLLTYMPLLLSEFLPYVVPVCFLLGLVFTFGRLEADGEWTAIQMAGIHPFRAIAPAFAVALALSLFTWWLLAEELPRICRVQKSYQITASKTLFQNLSPGRTEISIGKAYLSALSREGKDFLDVVMVLPGERGSPARKFVADRVHFEFRDSDVLVYPKNLRTISGSFDLRSADPVLRIDLDQLRAPGRRTLSALRYRESTELHRLIEEGVMPDRSEDYRYEIEQRRATAAMCLVFLFLGVPTALRLWRRRQLVAIAASIGYALLYYVLSMRLGHLLLDHHLLAAGPSAWVLPLGGAGIGAVLCASSLRPSRGPR